jgi:hypothetical protein
MEAASEARERFEAVTRIRNIINLRLEQFVRDRTIAEYAPDIRKVYAVHIK